jgi:broad specificity phosphatase PhoE
VITGQHITSPPSRRGKAQVSRTVEQLLGRDITAIYASPAVCAMYVARELAHGVHPITIRTGLADIDAGAWTGKTWREVYYEDSAAALAMITEPEKFGYPGGETLPEWQKRVAQTVHKCASAHTDTRCAIVTHPACSCAVIAKLLKQPVQRIREIEQDHGAFNILRLVDGVLDVCAVNVTHDDRAERAAAF